MYSFAEKFSKTVLLTKLIVVSEVISLVYINLLHLWSLNNLMKQYLDVYMLTKLVYAKFFQTQLTTIKITIYIAESQPPHDWPTRSGHVQQKKDSRNPAAVLKTNPLTGSKNQANLQSGQLLFKHIQATNKFSLQ